MRAGESVLVTDRGEVVAELGPPGPVSHQRALPPGLAALARSGLLALGQANSPSAYPELPPLLATRRADQLLDEARGPR